MIIDLNIIFDKVYAAIVKITVAELYTCVV